MQLKALFTARASVRGFKKIACDWDKANRSMGSVDTAGAICFAGFPVKIRSLDKLQFSDNRAIEQCKLLPEIDVFLAKFRLLLEQFNVRFPRINELFLEAGNFSSNSRLFISCASSYMTATLAITPSIMLGIFGSIIRQEEGVNAPGEIA